MILSLIIPFRNDFEQIDAVIANLTRGIPAKDLEVIIVNDGSVYGSGKFRPLELPNVKVINNPVSFGVGYAFDRGAEACSGDIVVLMGADVFPREGWYDKIVEAVNSTPETLGCSVCVGLNPKRMSMDDPECFRRYGADLLFYVTEDDLPPKSMLRNKKGGYTALFKAKWLLEKQSDEPYEIPCILGAFYFTSKAYYKRLRGWDTVAGNRYCGHKTWGALESYISLKSWLHGGGCTLYPDIEAGHVFARYTRRNRWAKGGRSQADIFWNQLFILETMILTPSLHNALEDFLHTELNLNVARKWIRNNYNTVLRVREQNRQEFKFNHTIFTDKFGYCFDIK